MCLDEMDREIMKDVFHPSHGVQVILSHLSSCRTHIFQERGPWDSLRQNPGDNQEITNIYQVEIEVSNAQRNNVK